MLFRREEYLELMTFGEFERPMFCELFGLLVGLEDEWREQGASDDEISLVAFDFDYMKIHGCGGNVWMRGGLEEVIIEESDTMLIKRDRLGRTMKLDKRTATIPVPQDFPVKNMDDWLKLKPMFEFDEDRVELDVIEAAKKAQAEGEFVVGNILGGFDVARELMGEEVACMAYYDQPELMHDILDTVGGTAEKVYERVCDKLVIDQLSVHEDMAGRSGPLIGPRQMKDFVGPYYRRVWDVVRASGTKLFDIDTDGDAGPIIDDLLEAGINSMHPFEPAAGMDVVKVRKEYGKRLVMRGGIDKHVLAKDKAAIRDELEYKMQPGMREGGMVFALDHRRPNGTPLENYRYYVGPAREILGLPRLDGKRKGWGRMAF